MATTPFLESPRFPDNIAFGATVGPTYQTVVVPIYSGRDGRIVAWTQARVRFEVGLRTMNAALTATLDAFFRSVKGRAYGFRIKDWTDFNDGGLGVLTATASPNVFQMGKVYSSQGTLSETRIIQKPVAGTCAFYWKGTLQTTTVSLDTTTGLVTFAPLAEQTITGVTVGSTTVVTLAAALPELVAGDTLYLQGLGGAGAGTLNNQAFVINSISGAAYTLAANTTGQTITASGQGVLFPQASDSLTWTGQFDVPVRFDVDEMKKQLMDRNGPNGDLLVDWGSIPVIEVRI
jgi:uncharacterized protein (TIGR02217 family)